jgi:hypothetical protein
MVWEFPAVSQSRKEFWGEPQYTRFGMWLFTLFFGFFGLHHLMLRSPQTALMCCLVNIFTFGYWYFYDLIQLSSKEYGGLGDDGLNAYGLGSPWGPLGIAQGMWIQPPSLPKPPPGQPQQPQQQQPHQQPQQPQQGGSKEPAKPKDATAKPKGAMAEASGNFALHFFGLLFDWMSSTRPVIPKVMDSNTKDPWLFLLYGLTIWTGIFPALFAGDTMNAFFRLTLILLFPILICIIIYDVFMLLVFPASTIFHGMDRPFPYSIFNYIDLNGHSGRVTCTRENPIDPDAMKDLLKTYVSLFQEGAALAESGLAYVPAAAPGALVQQGKEVLNLYVQKMKHDMAMQNTQQGQATNQPTNQQKPLPIQSGGGSLAPFAGLVTAAVIGGGLFLAASRSYVEGKDDPPPNTGTF